MTSLTALVLGLFIVHRFHTYGNWQKDSFATSRKKGETVAFHIFFIPINHNPSTYTLSVTRCNPFPWLYLILLLAWKIVVISFTLYLKILMVPERSLFSYWRYKILPGLKFHLPLFKHMLSLFTPFNT